MDNRKISELTVSDFLILIGKKENPHQKMIEILSIKIHPSKNLVSVDDVYLKCLECLNKNGLKTLPIYTPLFISKKLSKIGFKSKVYKIQGSNKRFYRVEFVD